LVQFEVNLMLISLKQVSFDLFYQIILKDYGNFSTIEFENPINVRKVLLMMKISVKEIDEFLENILPMRGMLLDYFAIDIEKSSKKNISKVQKIWRLLYQISVPKLFLQTTSFISF